MTQPVKCDRCGVVPAVVHSTRDGWEVLCSCRSLWEAGKRKQAAVQAWNLLVEGVRR